MKKKRQTASKRGSRLGKQTGRQTGRPQLDRQFGRQAGRQTQREAGKQADRQKERQSKREIEREAGKQAGSQAVCFLVQTIQSTKKKMQLYMAEHSCVYIRPKHSNSNACMNIFTSTLTCLYIHYTKLYERAVLLFFHVVLFMQAKKGIRKKKMLWKKTGMKTARKCHKILPQIKNKILAVHMLTLLKARLC